MHSYWKRRKQGVKINDTEYVFQVLLSDTSQGYILGPILFNIVTNDFIFFIKDVEHEILQMTIQFMQAGIVEKYSWKIRRKR